MMESPCVEWTGAVAKNGYGIARVGKTTTTASRVAWVNAHGPIQEGLQIDHLCRNRLCVNVDHLEPVTRLENVRRAPWTQVTHCKRGHPLSGDNLYVQHRVGRSFRHCRFCQRAAQRRWYALNKPGQKVAS